MKFLNKILLILIIPAASYAQDTAVVGRQARLIAMAIMKENYEVLASHTYPKIVSSVGGKDKMIDVIRQGTGIAKEQGIKIISASTGTPGKFYKAGTEIHCLVPETIILTTPGGRMINNSNLLAISNDGGKFWYFLDVNSSTYDKIPQMFPNFNKKLVIPKPTKPVSQTRP